MSLNDISSKAWLQNTPASRLERAKAYLGTNLATHRQSTFVYTQSDKGNPVLQRQPARPQ